jgi:DNA-binding NtrC family response regulator
MGCQGLHFSAEAERAIRHYSWPGNVRELENAIERAVILCEGQEICTELLGIDIELQEQEQEQARDFIGLPAQQGTSQEPAEDLSLEDYFQHFVLEHQEHMTETELARKLGISRKCLWERRQRLGIPRSKIGAATGT